jgi:YceI-like domain
LAILPDKFAQNVKIMLTLNSYFTMYKFVLLFALLLLGGFVILQKSSPSKQITPIQCNQPQLQSMPSFSAFKKPKVERFLELQTKESQVGWSLDASAENGGYAGTLKFTIGRLLIKDDGSIKEGDFVIDLNAIESSVIRSDEFLAVSKFPKAYFSVLQITPRNELNILTSFDNQQMVQVTGNLTLHGVTYPIVFNAFWQDVERLTNVKAEISIDGAKWGIPTQFTTQAIKIKLDLVFNNGGC